MAKILVVDDDASIRFFLQALLGNEGHDVVPVASGEEALTRIAAEEFDLALLDLMLPGISGTDVLAALRQRWPDTVVIVLTGYGSLETAVAALRQGAHDYLFKPSKTVELRESIRVGLLNRQQRVRQREVLRQLEAQLSSSLQEVRATIGTARGDAPLPSSFVAQGAPMPQSREPTRFLQYGRLIVDLPRHVITLAGHVLELSPTEFDLLAYLISEAPRVVPPQELMREVQGYESGLWEARDTIRYHVHRIRQKMKVVTGPDVEGIRTVRGVGYTVEEQERK